MQLMNSEHHQQSVRCIKRSDIVYSPAVLLCFLCAESFFSCSSLGYGGFDSYNGFNNYCFGNGMFDERVRGERGGRGKVQM